MKAFVPLLALFAIAAAFVAPATASADDDMSVVYADLNGDHRIDRVTLAQAQDNPNDQILVGTVGPTSYYKRIPTGGEPVSPLRVVDLDQDGRQEVLVTELNGISTSWFGVWHLNNGYDWQPVLAASGGGFELYEGGGIREISRYGCKQVNGHREVVLLSAQLQDPWEDEIYAGRLQSFTVRNGVATPTSTTFVAGHSATLTAMAIPSYCV
ncbi:hypothetical protein [Actinophytocola sp.]|uniref:hypothetical protein n=1 Tax=Actinophytocola sp. TaxID=1872138 RepID=UPI002D445044|nr:hypothetical protein [Actinophytocola sp.]HYQ69520.1 hypothetical protein [Actinophytocola sp.]